jgi:DENN domain-containing protein 5
MSLTKSFIDYFAVCGLDTKYGLEQDENTGKNFKKFPREILIFYLIFFFLKIQDENITCKCPLKRSYKCKVLHHFPENNAENKFDAEALINLCLPKGLMFEKREIKPKFHEFIITRENGSRVYGAALTFYELVDDELICGAMQTLQTMYEAEYSILKAHNYTRSSSSTQLAATKSDKKLTKYDYNVKKDKLYACKCICLLSQMPFNFSFGQILKTLYDMVKNTDLLGIKIESHLFNLLCEVPMPLDGQLMKFFVGCKAVHTYRPPRDSLPLFEYDLFDFFKLLNVNNAINLYITALMEHQILLYSKGNFKKYILN